jgi:hypothetical protein
LFNVSLAGGYVACADFSPQGEQISEALVLRRSEAGRFAYNLRVPRSPIRPHADTPTRSFVVAAPPRCVVCGLFQFRSSGLVQGSKSANRSGRLFLVVRFLKYQTQTDYVLEVNGLSRFYVHRLLVFVHEWQIVMADDAISR